MKLSSEVPYIKDHSVAYILVLDMTELWNCVCVIYVFDILVI